MRITGKTAIEISDSVRALVQKGELRPGDSLPPVRDLAEALEVNRNTVAASYQRLVQAGVAITQGRLGTSICKPTGPGEQEGISQGTALIDLADGNPNPAWLPNPFTMLSESTIRPFLYGDDTVLPELKQIAEAWLGPDCPKAASFELTHGAVDAIERLAAAHLVLGDKVAVEDPGFLGTIGALRLAGMRVVGVAVDDAGMVPESLQTALENGVRAVLLTPRAQNPTGSSLTAKRATALKKVLANYPGVLVLVDDHYCLLAETPYYSVIPPSTQRWALIRSVSKGLGPDLRVALIASDADTAERLRNRLAPGMGWVSHILQAMVVAGLNSATTRQILDGARQDYIARRHALCQALKNVGIETSSTSSGLNLWIPLSRDAKDVSYELAKKGWLVRLGSRFDVQGASQAIRVTISKFEQETAQRFAEDLRGSIVSSERLAGASGTNTVFTN